MKKRIDVVLFLLITSVVLLSCGIKLKGAKKMGGGKVETFLVGDGVMQYFVRPMAFRSHRSSMLVDFTCREKKDATGYKGKINFSIPVNEAGKIDSYQVVNSANNTRIFSCGDVTMMSAGKNRRYFSDVNNIRLYDLLRSKEKFAIVIFKHAEQEVFTPSSKTAKKMRKVGNALLED